MKEQDREARGIPRLEIVDLLFREAELAFLDCRPLEGEEEKRLEPHFLEL